MSEKESVQHFLELFAIRKHLKFKICTGISDDMGKSYRMLRETGSGLAISKEFIEAQSARSAWIALCVK